MNGIAEAVIGLVVVSISAMTFLIRRQLMKIDESVNHKHKHGRTETLYDLQHSQTMLLERLVGDVDELVEANRVEHAELFNRVADIRSKVECHCADDDIHKKEN